MDNPKNVNESFKNFSFKDDMPDIGGDNSLNFHQSTDDIEQILATPGPERDRVVVAFIEQCSPEEREDIAFFYRIAPEEALRRWYAAGDLVAGEALANKLYYNESKADTAEAKRIAKEIFPKRPSAKVANVQLGPGSEEEIESKQYNRDEVIQIGETAIDYEMEHGIEGKTGRDLTGHLGILAVLQAAYRGETQPLLKYDKYGRSCRAEKEAAEKIDEINKSDAAGMGYSLVELIFSLYCLGVSLWFLPAGSEFLGNWFGMVPLIAVALLVWIAAGSLVGGVISGAVVYGVAWALDRYWVNAPFNASMLLVALIGALFLWSAFSDICTSRKWKKGQPERDKQAAEHKKNAQRELAFRKSFCQRRLDLCKHMEEDAMLSEVKDSWKEFKQVYQNELNEVKKEAERLKVTI